MVSDQSKFTDEDTDTMIDDARVGNNPTHIPSHPRRTHRITQEEKPPIF